MPRKTELKSCVKCGGKAQVGICTGYYVLSCKSGTGPQIKGALPARGCCIECLLRAAKAQGLDRVTRAKLQRKLEPVEAIVKSDRPDKGPKEVRPWKRPAAK
jgi:hypothetical protein